MLKIELQNLQFHAYHGIHEEESKAGGNFEVNLVVYFKPVIVPVRLMEETVDYVKLYKLLKYRMEKPTKLLETLVTEISAEILSKFPLLEEVYIEIRKLNPPIPFFKGSVAAAYTLKRNQLQ